MTSQIFISNACAACRQANATTTSLRVLRTRTRDICTSCGAILQEFPPVTVERQPGVIAIPSQVSQLLENLLTHRLFTVDSGIQPNRVNANEASRGRNSNTLAHRAGDQCFIELSGPANASIVLRWNYSSKSLLPKFPWLDLRFDIVGGRPKWNEQPELKPKIEDAPSYPAGVERALPFFSRFELTEQGTVKGRRELSYLRFEQRFEVGLQPLDTTDDLVLVVKAEIKWLKIGLSFPSGAGKRAYGVRAGNQVNWPLCNLTLEEAVDAAVFMVLHDFRSFGAEVQLEGGFGYLVKAEDPIRLARRVNPYSKENDRHGEEKNQLVHTSLIAPFGHLEDQDFYGALLDGDTRILPHGLEYKLAVVLPELKSGTDRELPRAGVVVKIDGMTVIDKQFGGPGYRGGYATTMRQIEYSLALELPDKPLSLETVITDDVGTRTTQYKLIPKDEYLTAYLNWSAEVTEKYKRELAAKARAVEITRVYDSTFDFERDRKVAVLIDYAWHEGRYMDKQGVFHRAAVSPAGTPQVWQGIDIKPLETALKEGLYVRPPHKDGTSHGFEFALASKVEPEEGAAN